MRHQARRVAAPAGLEQDLLGFPAGDVAAAQHQGFGALECRQGAQQRGDRAGVGQVQDDGVHRSASGVFGALRPAALQAQLRNQGVLGPGAHMDHAGRADPLDDGLGRLNAHLGLTRQE